MELGDLTPHNIKQLKLLNSVLFPVSYNENFYKEALKSGDLAKLGEQLDGAPGYRSPRCSVPRHAYSHAAGEHYFAVYVCRSCVHSHVTALCLPSNTHPRFKLSSTTLLLVLYAVVWTWTPPRTSVGCTS